MIYTIGVDKKYTGIEHAEISDVLEYFENKPTIELDTETSGIDCHSDKILSLQLGDSDNQFFIDTRRVDIKEFKRLIEKKLCILQNCLPSYTEILTTRGWKNIKDIEKGETIYGHTKDGISKVKVKNTFKYTDSPLITMYNTGRRVESTPNHRWLVIKRKGTKIEYKTTTEILSENRDYNIVMNTSYNNTNIGSSITNEELKLLVWAITDGHIHFGKKGKPGGVSITQAPHKFCEDIEALQRHFKIETNYSLVKGYNDMIPRRYYFPAHIMRKIGIKIGLTKDYDFTKLVLALNSIQLRVFHETFIKAEGCDSCGIQVIGQSFEKNRNKRDAIALCSYLMGFTQSFNKDSVVQKTSKIIDGRTIKTENRIGESFCLETECGNFVMRQGELITLTGNSKFDYKMLRANGIALENIYDTMLAECVLYTGYKKWGYSLSDLTARYLGIRLEKETRSTFSKIVDEPFNEKQIRYGCLDVTHLGKIRDIQLEKLAEKELMPTINLENEVVKALADIEFNGCSFLPEKWMEICHQTQLEAQNLVENLDALIVEDRVLSSIYRPEYVQTSLFNIPSRELSINYASPAQILKICEQLGYKTESTDEKHLTRLKNKHPFFSTLLELRKKNKIISTYGESFLGYINPTTGRIHTSYWQIVETGRTSSGSKHDNAPNMQNLPRKGGFVDCFVSRPGWSWISADYSGQEARIMASASQDKGLIDILNSGKDIHCEVGTMMFKKPITMEDKEERYLAKTVNFMVPYGAAARKLADEMEIAEDEAEKLLELHSEAFPALHRWLREMGRKGKKEEFITTIGPIKRKRFFPEMQEAKQLRKTVKQGDKITWKKILITEGQVERNSGNTPIQGAASDMTKQALVGVRNLIKSYNTTYNDDVAALIGMVHDSIESEARDDIAEDFAYDKETIMVDIANKYLDGVVMKTDVKIDKKWPK